MTNEELKAEIIDLLKSTKRKGMNKLIKYMEDNYFFDAPCSTRFHLCEEGGLAKHSLNVCNTAMDLALTLLGEAEYAKMQSSIIICSLLHDLGKAGGFGEPYYKKAELLKSGKEPAKPYEMNKELLGIDHCFLSAQIAGQFIPLSKEEYHAILCHDGLYGTMARQIQGHETKLFMILHWADMWCSRVVEVGKGEE